jgi:hypothetical protein
MLDAEALDAAHHDARLKGPSLEDVDEGVGEKRVARTVALAEVRGELQAVVDH